MTKEAVSGWSIGFWFFLEERKEGGRTEGREGKEGKGENGTNQTIIQQAYMYFHRRLGKSLNYGAPVDAVD